jgi:transcriptional regulator with XRE-family HTH domain
MVLSELVEKIKNLRSEKGFTLEQLARRSGLSKGYLSKIENELSIPTVTTLHKIAAALGVDSTYLFLSNDIPEINKNMVYVRKNQRKKVVIELPEKRKKTSAKKTESGIRKRWPLASQKLGRNMDPYIVEISHDHDDIYQHEGEEFFYIIEGKVEFSYGGKSYTFEEGDTIYIDCNVPYSAKSINEKPAKVLLVLYYYKRIGAETITQLTVPNKKVTS